MPVTTAKGLAPHLYTDPQVFAQERARIFRGGWCAVARSEALRGPNTYVALDLFEDPIVVTRSDRGEIAAFSMSHLEDSTWRFHEWWRSRMDA